MMNAVGPNICSKLFDVWVNGCCPALSTGVPELLVSAKQIFGNTMWSVL